MFFYSVYIMANETKYKEADLMILFHELLQSAQVIQAYAWGCKERLQHNEIPKEDMIQTLSTIYDHIALMGNKINQFNM